MPSKFPFTKKHTFPQWLGVPLVEKGHLAHDHALSVEISLPTVIGQCEYPCPSPNSGRFRKVIPAERSFCDDQGPKVFCSILLAFFSTHMLIPLTLASRRAVVWLHIRREEIWIQSLFKNTFKLSNDLSVFSSVFIIVTFCGICS